MQLETTFTSTSTIKSVAAFLRSSLKEDIKAHKFILCSLSWDFSSIRMLNQHPDQAPPKREFRVSDPEIKGKSLHDLQLTPSSVLQVKFLDDSLDREW
jgi:tether containing UBX domain for GLUT4